jgi:hypothetical protein
MKMENEKCIHNFTGLLELISRRKTEAALKTNEMIIRSYWQLGEFISSYVDKFGYKKNFYKDLCKVLADNFSGYFVFSPGNLRQCRLFYDFYSSSSKVRHLFSSDMHSPFFSLPWHSHVMIIDYSSSVNEALYYVYKAVCNDWNSGTLACFLKSKLYQKECNPGNFSLYGTPSPHGQLAHEISHDIFIFDFLSMLRNYDIDKQREMLLSYVLYKKNSDNLPN